MTDNVGVMQCFFLVLTCWVSIIIGMDDQTIMFNFEDSHFKSSSFSWWSRKMQQGRPFEIEMWSNFVF